MHIRQSSPDTKVQELCTQLRALAYRQGPETQLPTTRLLCDMLSTSRASLNEALNELEAQHVLYRKKRNGIFVSPKIYRKSINILLNSDLFIAPDISPFWGILWGLLIQEAQRRSMESNQYFSIYLVISLPGQEMSLPEEVLAMIATKTLHGVLAVGLDEPTSRWLTNQQIPLVAFAGYGEHMVASNAREMLRMAVDTLVEQGCQHIGMWLHEHIFWIGKSHNGIESQETVDLRRYLEEHGLQFDGRLVREYLHSSHEDNEPIYQELGYRTAMEVFGTPSAPRPDGLIIADDMMTHGALLALQELDLHVGKDIKIVTHANSGSPILFGQTRYMTLLEFNPKAYVQAMFTLLDQMLAGESLDPTVIWITPQLRRILR